MNWTTIGTGTLLCVYALTVLFLRISGKNKMFRKLEPMKEKFGNRAGSVIHYIGYVLIPLAAGITIILSGIQGMSILDWISA